MTDSSSSTPAPVILVPGFWLGAWAWDEVVAQLRAAGIEATALTLPGLEHSATDRSGITAEDHVDAICAAVEAAGRPVVLAVHSGAGFSGYAASDRVPDDIAAMVYVDSAPGVGALDPDFTDDELPLDWAQLSAEENLDGLSEDQLVTFRERAVPQPGAVVREAVPLRTDARRHIPTMIIATGNTSEQYRAWAATADAAFLVGLRELSDVTWVDLPTSHWPMWSRPADLARLLAQVATAHAAPQP